MLLTDERDVMRELDVLEEKHRNTRVDAGVELDRRTFMHWVAWGHLRRGHRVRAAEMYLRSGWENRSPRDVALAAAFALRAIVPVASARRALHALAPPSARPAAPVTPPPWLARYV
jgi:hypothetical protein